MGCLVVARGGPTVFEDCYGVARADAPDDVRSVTKSVTSLLVGLALDEGFLPGVDSAMGPWLQPVATTIADDRARITIRQLLIMTSGFDWYEGGDYALFNEWLRAPSQVDFLLARPLAFPPGSHYTYNTAASHLLSIVIQQATGQRLDAWARSRLFAPLGIGERRWLTDAQGFCHGGIGLYLSPRDMLALGTLVLDHGRRGGVRVVGEAWLSESLAPQVPLASYTFASGYGYLWWRGRAHGLDYVYANGYGGQFIVVVPEVRLVAVATCQWRDNANASSNWSRIMDAIVNQLLPSVR
ncbi:MAG TPA: serine hydrolase [Vicinamibacteria bacterium]|nr:serine hydrolase [Vicinamibacteria bacterium]